MTDKEEELKVLEEQEEVPNGITPPNTNVIKRKFEKTKRHTPFPVRGLREKEEVAWLGLTMARHARLCVLDTQKNDVARVEEDLVKIIQGGVIEDVRTCDALSFTCDCMGVLLLSRSPANDLCLLCATDASTQTKSSWTSTTGWWTATTRTDWS